MLSGFLYAFSFFKCPFHRVLSFAPSLCLFSPQSTHAHAHLIARARTTHLIARHHRHRHAPQKQQQQQQPCTCASTPSTTALPRSTCSSETRPRPARSWYVRACVCVALLCLCVFEGFPRSHNLLAHGCMHSKNQSSFLVRGKPLVLMFLPLLLLLLVPGCGLPLLLRCVVCTHPP